ncbi:MAG: hypothetical protein JO136_21595 [Hyphomicrobiales bacterium]|nr:hypothetical protein [Hyphomicrobiales bacterium]MBV9907695.1 hypothetical protein [Hyphomicrobiales bacterium]
MTITPTTVVIGDRDQVEHEKGVSRSVPRLLRRATFCPLKGVRPHKSCG